ncbi:MAG: helix-turn-helix domain-containing protein [Pseudomonadota bacterium]
MTNNIAEQVHRFLQIYNGIYEPKDLAFSKHDMVSLCKRMIYDSNGFIKIEKIAEKLGYTERYLNKLFTDEIGCSAKTLCKVVRFQALLTRFHHACFTNNMGKIKMVEIALELGFYDQAQMNKEFKSLAHITPKQYVALLEEMKYMTRIHDVPLA